MHHKFLTSNLDHIFKGAHIYGIVRYYFKFTCTITHFFFYFSNNQNKEENNVNENT